MAAASLRAAMAMVLLPACLAMPLFAQERPLDPLDEAAGDASWAGFRQELLDALERRDREHVLGILDPEVRSGLDGARGAAAFRREWELDAEGGPLWQKLAAVLALPAAYHRPEQGPMELCVPYVSVRWPQDMDAYRGGAIVVKDAAVKAAPSAEAPTVATLSYHIVEVADWEVNDRAADARQKWVRVRLKQGEGYVAEEQIRSPIEHTACFVKREAGWRLVGFGPGGGK